MLPDAFPGIDLLLPAGRYRQPDSQLRCAGSDRRCRSPGPDNKANEAFAHRLAEQIGHVAGIADVRVQQRANDYPELAFDVDRSQADRLGITENDVTKSLSVSLAGSFQVAPAFWLNPRNGVSYPIVVQAPQYRIEFPFARWTICR